MPAEMAQVLVDKNGRPAEYANGKNGPVWGGYKSFKNAEKVYLQITQLFPNTKLVECVKAGELMPPEEVHNKVWELVRRIALKDYKIQK